MLLFMMSGNAALKYIYIILILGTQIVLSVDYMFDICYSQCFNFFFKLKQMNSELAQKQALQM